MHYKEYLKELEQRMSSGDFENSEKEEFKNGIKVGDIVRLKTVEEVEEMMKRDNDYTFKPSIPILKEYGGANFIITKIGPVRRDTMTSTAQMTGYGRYYSIQSVDDPEIEFGKVVDFLFTPPEEV